MGDQPENLKPAALDTGTPVTTLAVDNQVGVGAGAGVRAQADATSLVTSKTLPDVQFSPLPPNNSDVLSAADQVAVQTAKTASGSNFDSTFYNKLTDKTGGLPDFKLVDLKAFGAAAGGDAHLTAASTTTNTAAEANLHKSPRIKENADGSGDATVKPGDSLWRIASDALKQNHPEGYKPSNKEILDGVHKLVAANHYKDINHVIHPNDTVHIPKELITKPPEIAKTPEKPKGPEVPIEVKGASQEFAAKVKKDFDSLPDNVKRLLVHNGTKIVVAGKISDADPSLKGVTPRGWPKGTQWDDDDGMYQAGPKAITIAETHHNETTGNFDKNTRDEGSVKHETGHAVDAAMGNESHSDEFKKAYDADVAKMTPAQREQLKYLLQPGDAGKEETFADVFGAMNGASGDPAQTAAVLAAFPSIRALIGKKVAELP